MVFVHPINKIYTKAENSLLVSKIREYSQLKLKEALTKQVDRDLEHIKEGTPAHTTIINMINNQIHQYTNKHTSKG